jgi:hypothetical protein
MNTTASIFSTEEIMQQMREVQDVINRLNIRRADTYNPSEIKDIDLALFDLKCDMENLTEALLSKVA